MLNNIILIIPIRYFITQKQNKFISISSFFSILGIIIGVASLIIIMSIMNGFHKELITNMININGEINVTAKNFSSLKIDSLLKEKHFFKYNITHISQHLIKEAFIKKGFNNAGVIVDGCQYKDLQYKNYISKKIINGNLSNFDNTNSVIIGERLAKKLCLQINDKLKLFLPYQEYPKNIPKYIELNIIAIFNTEIFNYDNTTILIPLQIAKTFFVSDTNLLEFHTKHYNQSIIVAKKLRTILNKDYFITSWLENNKQFLQALKMEKIAMFFILFLIILVSTFSILSNLSMFVINKNKDIGILKTIGMSNKQIMYIFIIYGGLITFIGSIIGTFLGVIFSYNLIYIKNICTKLINTKFLDFFYNLPSEIHILDIILAFFLSLLTGIIATIYPAYKATKLKPIELLKNE